MDKHPFNNWGHITSYTMEQMPIEIPDPARYDNFIQIATVGSIELTISAPATAEIVDAVSRWAKNGNGRLPIWAEEWMCLYCGSPQPLPLTHCGKCGAPRSWILG